MLKSFLNYALYDEDHALALLAHRVQLLLKMFNLCFNLLRNRIVIKLLKFSERLLFLLLLFSMNLINLLLKLWLILLHLVDLMLLLSLDF